MGLPWVLGAWYWKDKFDADYEQPAGALAFSVICFLICSLLCFLILICRRCTVGGELGGPKGTKYFTAILCFLLWAAYLSVSLCQIYEVFEVPESVLGPKFYSDRYPDKYPKLETADATVDEEDKAAVLLQSMIDQIQEFTMLAPQQVTMGKNKFCHLYHLNLIRIFSQCNRIGQQVSFHCYLPRNMFAFHLGRNNSSNPQIMIICKVSG